MMGESGGCVEGGWGGETRCTTATLPQTQKVESKCRKIPEVET